MDAINITDDATLAQPSKRTRRTSAEMASERATSDTPKKVSTQHQMPKWEADVRERLKLALKKFARPLADLAARDANEGDTRLLVTDFLCDALGYDKYADLTTEYMVKGEFADYGIRIEKQLVAFIEVKRIATKLDAKHLRQVEMYAVNEGVEWVILTNAAQWYVYHITGGLPVRVELALEVNLSSEESIAQKAQQLYYLTREALKKHQIDELWRAKRATSPRQLAKVLTQPAVLEAVRQELRRETGLNAEIEELSRLLRTTIIRAECFEGEGGSGTVSAAPQVGAKKVGRVKG